MQTEPLSWDDLRMLLAVHRGKSLLAAATTLGVATSTVARRIEALEDTLGRPLVHRGNSGTAIDAEALGLISLGEQMELGLEAFRRGPDSHGVSGTVRVAASEGMARPLVRVLARLQARYPALRHELASDSRLADLSKREADIGIRIMRVGGPTLIEKSTGHLRLAVFAARSYVERRLPGARLSRDQARHHDWVGFDKFLPKLPSEEWMRRYGAIRFAFSSSSPAAIEEALLAGLGLGVLDEGQGAALNLVRIETESTPAPVEVFLACHRDARKTPRVRATFGVLAAELKRALA